MAIIKVNLGRIVPTPAGIVDQRFLDGDDAGANPPTTPQIGQPFVIDDDSADVPLLVSSTGGTAPRHYELELSIVDAVSGFAVHDANADFSGDAVNRVTGLAPSTVYWVRIAAVDDDDRRSGYSAVFSFTTPAVVGGDVTAPTAPTSVNAVSTAPNQAVYTWTNGTDAVGIVTTRVIRGDGDGAGNPVGSGAVIDSVAYPTTSYTDLSAGSGQKFYRAEHLDAAGNISAKSARQFVTIATAGGGSGFKFHPGHYIKIQGDEAQSNQLTWRNKILNDLNANANDQANILGAFVQFAWGGINTTGSTYDWSHLDAVMDWMATNNKRLLLCVTYEDSGVDDVIMPADIIGANSYAGKHGGSIAAMHRPAVMDRFLTFMNALAARYNSHPNLEMFTTSESSPGYQTNPSDYSRPALVAQYARMYPAMRAAFTETIPAANLNKLAGFTSQLLELAYQAGCGMSSPDAHDTNSAILFRGENDAPGDDPAVRDYRGLMPFHSIGSAPVIVVGGKDYNGPPDVTINWAQNIMATHMSWVTAPAATWTEVKSDINADPSLNSVCPDVLGTCVS